MARTTLLALTTTVAAIGCASPQRSPEVEEPEREAAAVAAAEPRQVAVEPAPAAEAEAATEEGVAPECDIAPALAMLPPGCRPVAVTTATASRAHRSRAADLVDGSACTVWNSGGMAPDWIQLTLAAGGPVSGVLLLPEMTPNGEVEHLFEEPGQAHAPTAFAALGGQMESGAPEVAVFPEPHRAHWLRVRTTRSPSWVAWREVVPFGCEQHPTPSTRDVEPVEHEAAPRPVPEAVAAARTKVVFGRGACRTAADCAPVRCCQAPYCVSLAQAPGCRHVACPRSLSGPMLCEGCGCLCVGGRCAARVRDDPPDQGDDTLQQLLGEQ